MLGLQTQCQCDAGEEACDQNHHHFQEKCQKKRVGESRIALAQKWIARLLMTQYPTLNRV